MTMHQNEQLGFVLWMTGLSGAGKTTIALILEDTLHQRGIKIERLDGDVVRQSLTRDLGFTKEDRDKNIERVTFVAKLLSRNGVGCVCSFISPYQAVRDQVRAETTNFLEVFIDAPLEVVIDRDVKGLYFEAPANPDIHIRTDQQTPEESAQAIIEQLEARGLIPVAETA